MNLSDVERWRQGTSQRTDFSKPEVERWNRSRHGSVTTTVRGSHVDINVRLYRWAGYLWPILLTGAAVGLLFIISRILMAIVTGRAQQILDGISKASQ
jgi:hypothetical protein